MFVIIRQNLETPHMIIEEVHLVFGTFPNQPFEVLKWDLSENHSFSLLHVRCKPHHRSIRASCRSLLLHQVVKNRFSITKLCRFFLSDLFSSSMQRESSRCRGCLVTSIKLDTLKQKAPERLFQMIPARRHGVEEPAEISMCDFWSSLMPLASEDFTFYFQPSLKMRAHFQNIQI